MRYTSFRLFFLLALISVLASCGSTANTQVEAKPLDFQMPGCDTIDASKFGTAEAAVNESEKTGVKPISITEITLGSLKATKEGGVAMTISGDKTSLTIDGSLWDGSVVLELQPKASIAFGASDGSKVVLATCMNNSEKPKIFRGKYETKGKFSPFTGNVMRN